jgi:hypothetical protein
MPRQDSDDLNGNPATKREHPSDAPPARCDEPGCTEDATRHWSTYAGGRLVARRHTCRDHENREGKATPKRPRSAVGESLHVHGDAVEHVEALYQAAQGEVTDEIEQAEAARDLTGREALEAVARFLRWCDDQDAAVTRERERLDTVESATARRRRWATEKAAALVETLAPGRSKATAGTYTVKVSRTHATEAERGLDPRTLPAAWQRPTEPVPAIPAGVALDKKAAKAEILGPWHEGPPPEDGWYEVEGHGRVWLWHSDGPDPSTWAIGREPGDRIVAPSLAAAGLSIEPEPGLDQLRWRRAHPSVRVVENLAVKVG